MPACAGMTTTLHAQDVDTPAYITRLLFLAEALALPYTSVLAGLGIGGLAVALAARSTLETFSPAALSRLCARRPRGTAQHTRLSAARVPRGACGRERRPMQTLKEGAGTHWNERMEKP